MTQGNPLTPSQLKALLDEAGRNVTLAGQLWLERHPPEGRGRGRPADPAGSHWQEEARHRIREASVGVRKRDLGGVRRRVLGEVREWLQQVRGKAYSFATLRRWAKESHLYRLEDPEPKAETSLEKERRLSQERRQDCRG